MIPIAFCKKFIHFKMYASIKPGNKKKKKQLTDLKHHQIFSSNFVLLDAVSQANKV